MKNKYQKIPTDLAERKEWIDFVYSHPVVKLSEFGYFHLDITPTYVDPQTRMTDPRDPSKNTHFEVWIEGGPPHDMSKNKHWQWTTPKGGWDNYNKWSPTHDINLDCGGDTLEEALLNFAARLKYYYNDDGSDTGVEDRE